MKKALLVVCLALVLALIPLKGAKAVILLPGDTDIAATGAWYPDGTLVASMNDVSFIGLNSLDEQFFTGSLNQWVYENETGMLFVYQVYNDPTSADPIAAFSATNFTGFETDADITGDNDMPQLFALEATDGLGYLRRSSSGSTVGFRPPFGVAGLYPGDTSPYFWIQTNAKYYGPGSMELQDGGNARVSVYGPAVPEPATLSLLGVGILGLFGIRRKRI